MPFNQRLLGVLLRALAYTEDEQEWISSDESSNASFTWNRDEVDEDLREFRILMQDMDEKSDPLFAFDVKVSGALEGVSRSSSV